MAVGTERPYPPHTMDTAGWQTITPECIDWCTVTTTQRGVWIDALLNRKLRDGSDTIPHVVEFEGQYYLEDGHTRVVRSVLSGSNRGMARVFHCVLDK